MANLTRNDFVLTDRGKPQAIGVFSVESVSTPGAAQVLPENTFSNLRHGDASTPNAVSIILFDRLNTLTGSSAQPYEDSPVWVEDQALARAKQQVLKFVQDLDPKDRVAVYSLSNSLNVLCDFTSDRQELKAILTRYRATSITGREEVDPRAIHTPVPGDFNALVDQDRRNLANLANAKRTAITMAALTEIATHVADIPGRKNLIWLTANLPFSGVEIARALSRANLAIYPVDARGLLPRTSPLAEDGAPYVAALRTRSAPESEPAGLGTMEELADQTGGRAFLNTNDLSGAIRKAVEDTEVTYTLGFYPDARSLDGKFHALKVHVNRSGLNVRYPKGYFALKDVSPPGEANNFQTALRSPLESAVVPLLARLDRVNEPKANSLRVTGSVDIHNVQLAESAEIRKGALEIYIFQQDVSGRVLEELRNKLILQFTREDYLKYLKSGVFFQETLQPKEGLATLRVLVGDPVSGMIGSLIIPVAQVK